jgi:hypothetical protein
LPSFRFGHPFRLNDGTTITIRQLQPKGNTLEQIIFTAYSLMKPQFSSLGTSDDTPYGDHPEQIPKDSPELPFATTETGL